MNNIISSSNTSVVVQNSSTIVLEPAEPAFLPWNNPHNVITVQTFLAFEEIINCGLSLVVFCVGVPTNLLSCLVFCRQGLRDRMNLCLFSLALVDLSFVTCFYLVVSFCLVEHVWPEDGQWWKNFARKYFTGLYRGFLYSSGCLTMLIAIERCVCVTWPLRAASLVRTRTVGTMIVTVVLSLQALCLIYPLELGIETRVRY